MPTENNAVVARINRFFFMMFARSSVELVSKPFALGD
jgi:hypothetical protein